MGAVPCDFQYHPITAYRGVVEDAARGGLIGKRYPWGDEITHDDANYEGIGGKDKWDRQTAPVRSFEPN